MLFSFWEEHFKMGAGHAKILIHGVKMQMPDSSISEQCAQV